MSHASEFRVYYEDTDMAGIVYYANYFKFIERARSDWVRGLGIDQRVLKEEHDIVFAVNRVEADFKRPAKLDDVLSVETVLRDMSGARIVLEQKVFVDQAMLFDCMVTLVCLSASGRPLKIPADIRQLMGG